MVSVSDAACGAGADETAIVQLAPGVQELPDVDDVTALQAKLLANVASTELSKAKESLQPTSVAQTDMLTASVPAVTEFETHILSHQFWVRILKVRWHNLHRSFVDPLHEVVKKRTIEPIAANGKNRECGVAI